MPPLPPLPCACLRHWLLTALVLCAAGPSPAAAESLPVGGDGRYALAPVLSTLEDPEGRLTIGDITAPDNTVRFRPAAPDRGELNFGYSRATYWIAVPLRLARDAPAHWLLEAGYSSLDRVEVYTPRPGGGYTQQVAGDLQPFAERLFPHRHLVFPIDLVPGAAQTLYLRVVSQGNLTVPLTLWQPAALHAHDQRTYALLSLYYGMLLALLLYNLLLYCAVRDPAFLAYVAFVACMIVGQASLNGFGNQFLWPAWPAWGNVALPSGMSAAGFFGILFTRLFLGTRDAEPRLDRMLVALAVAFAFSALSPLVLPYRFAAMFTSIAGIGGAVVMVASGVVCLRKGHPGARYFLIAWTLLLAGVAILAMRNMGWLPTNAFTTYAMQIGSALEMLLLSFALAERINSMRREKELATQEALAAKQSAVETLRNSELELERRVAERTLALGMANQRLREKEQELQHIARHDPLTGLANRALLDERIPEALSRARRADRRVALLLVDLDGFKAVNDDYGHAIGDELLVIVGRKLAGCIRETDTIARLGGDEFVVLLESLGERGEASQVADKLVAAVDQPMALSSGAVAVTASVGIAYFPDDADNPQALLNHADSAMYAAKADGRNRWRMADREAERTRGKPET
ncbi:MAG: 7TM diverse intracellular signaling domain-containing protein [Burkholderiales bacterium]